MHSTKNKMRAKVAEEDATQCRTRILQKCVQDELLSHARHANMRVASPALLSSPGPPTHLSEPWGMQGALLKAEASKYVYTNARIAESQIRRTQDMSKYVYQCQNMPEKLPPGGPASIPCAESASAKPVEDIHKVVINICNKKLNLASQKSR